MVDEALGSRAAEYALAIHVALERSRDAVFLEFAVPDASRNEIARSTEQRAWQHHICRVYIAEDFQLSLCSDGRVAQIRNESDF